MTPDQIHPGHTYRLSDGRDTRIETVRDGYVYHRELAGTLAMPAVVFASLCVRDITPAPESDQGEKVAHAQDLELCGDSVAVRAFAIDVAEYLYRAGHRDDGPGNSEGVRLLRLAREIAEANQ